jgi:3-oxoacyl-ACP reductase-like protein
LASTSSRDRCYGSASAAAASSPYPCAAAATAAAAAAAAATAGAGTPHDREKRAARVRLALATSNAHEYRLEREGLVSEETGDNWLTQGKGLDAIVEDKASGAGARACARTRVCACVYV